MAQDTSSSAAPRIEDPLADIPHGEWPLRLYTGYPDIPAQFIKQLPHHAEYENAKPPIQLFKNRPRIVDIWASTFGFDSDTDCSQLRTMDAIVTILYDYDPKLLKMFYLDVKPHNHIVELDCSSSDAKQFDLLIKRERGFVNVGLFRKVIFDGEVKREQYTPDSRPPWPFSHFIRSPFLNAQYCFADSIAPGRNHIYDEWEDQRMTGACLKAKCGPDYPSVEVLEYQDKCFARYLLLSKLWKQPGVTIQCKITTQKSVYPEKESMTYDWPRPVVKAPYKSAGENIYWEIGGKAGVEFDHNGYPAKDDMTLKAEEAIRAENSAKVQT